MNYGRFGIFVSFSLHALLTALVITTVSQPPPFQLPMALDFQLIPGEKAVPAQPAQMPPPAAAKELQLSRQEKKTPPEPAQKKIERRAPPVGQRQEPEKIVAPAPVQKKELKISTGSASSAEKNPPVKAPPKQSETEVPHPAPAARVSALAPTAAESEAEKLLRRQQRYVKENFAVIQNQVRKFLVYPRLARKMGWEGRVVVCFDICPTGQVENMRIVESSGHTVLDRNALETVKLAAPFETPPVRAKLTVPIIYRLRDA